KAAIAALEKSMALRGNGNSFDWFFLAMAYAQQGNRPLALKWLRLGQFWVERVERKSTAQQVNYFLAEAAKLLGVPEKALDLPASSDKNLRQVLDIVLELTPDAADLQETLGRLMRDAGHFQDADHAFEKAVQTREKRVADPRQEDPQWFELACALRE